MKSTQVKVSIIMGTYNPDEKKLKRAVQSLILQTVPEWELLLYDDGSDGQFVPLIRETAMLDGRIRLLRGTENRGLAAALNRCLLRARGQYIARMDDDDVSLPNRLERQLVFLESHPQYQWVGSGAELIDENGVWGFQRMPEIPQPRDFLFHSPYIHPSVMFRKSALIRGGGYCTAKAFLQVEDYELFFRLHRLGMRGYNLSEPLLRYWEDYASYQKRTYRRRIREAKLRYHGFRGLGILNSGTFCYVLKPLLVGVIPPPVHHYIRRRVKAGPAASREKQT